MCNHTQTANKSITKTFRGQEFHADVAVCTVCGEDLWTAEAQDKYMAWLGELYSSSKTKDLFSIQAFFTDDASLHLAAWQRRYPGVDRSQLIRSLTMVYIELVAPHHELVKIVDAIASSKVYSDLTQLPAKQKVPVRFRPAGYEVVMGLSEAFGIPPAKIVENASQKMLALLDWLEDGRLREEAVILKAENERQRQKLRDVACQVDLVLKAA